MDFTQFLKLAGMLVLLNLPLALLLLLAAARTIARPGFSANRFRTVAKLFLVVQGLIVSGVVLFGIFMWRFSTKALEARTEIDPGKLQAALGQARGIFLVAPLVVFLGPLLVAILWFILTKRQAR